jgi:hypothetical protein
MAESDERIHARGATGRQVAGMPTVQIVKTV